MFAVPFRFFRCRAGAEVADQPGPRKSRSLRGVCVALPTGSASIAGRGAQPYLQFPWSWELRDGWGLSGMFTEFFRPSDPTPAITETTFVIEEKLAANLSV